MQWPELNEDCYKIAAYLIKNLKINPYVDVIKNFNKDSHEMRVVNGTLSLNNLVFPISLINPENVQTAFLLKPLQLVKLALNCILWYDVGNGISFIRGALLSNCNPFVKQLWEEVSYAHTWPVSIDLAASCARPDIMIWCRKAYFAWLSECRRPNMINDIMTTAINAQWNVKVPSQTFDTLHKLINGLQIAAKQCPVNLIPDIIINRSASIIISKKDKALLAFLAFRGPDKKLLLQIKELGQLIEEFNQNLQNNLAPLILEELIFDF